MKERFEPFKELLKALREIKYAIGGKDNGAGEGNGSDIVLPKYVLCNYNDLFADIFSDSSSSSSSSQSELSESNPDEGGAPGTPFPGLLAPKVLEIDYSGKLANILYIMQEEEINLSGEEKTNFIQYYQNHTINPIYGDGSKEFNWPYIYLYTKEQIDIINENSIVQLDNGMTIKLDDNVVIDILDNISSIARRLDNVQRGQYYCIILKELYDKIPNMPTPPDLEPGR